MIVTLIVLTVLYAFFIIGKSVYHDEGFIPALLMFAMCTMVSLFFLYAIFFIGVPNVINKFHNITKTEYYYSDVVFLNNQRGYSMAGNGFFLGWHFNGEGKQTYILTLKKSEGYIKKEVDATRVFVEESSNTTPRLLYEDRFIHYNCPKWLSPIDVHFEIYYRPFKIVVPEGTIIKQINQI